LSAARMCSLMVQGQFTIEEIHSLWQAKDTTNPVAALRAALKRAGVVGDLTVWRAGEGALRNPLTALARQREDWCWRPSGRQTPRWWQLAGRR
jgi:hypothetical protein